MYRFKNEKSGITLIALVITVIVLLILAGISISMMSGDNSILSRAGEARTNTVHSNVYERMQLEVTGYTLEKTTGNYSNSLIDYLKLKSIISVISGEEDKWLINVATLLGSSQPMGMGTYPNDVYVLEKQETQEGSEGRLSNTKVATTTPIRIALATNSQSTYQVVYYGKNVNENATLGNLIDGSGTANLNATISSDENGKMIITTPFGTYYAPDSGKTPKWDGRDDEEGGTITYWVYNSNEGQWWTYSSEGVFLRSTYTINIFKTHGPATL